MHNQNNKFLKKKLFFLGLMNKNKSNDIVEKNLDSDNITLNIPATLYPQFVKLHIPLLSSLYVSEYADFWKGGVFDHGNTTTLKLLYYYSNFNKSVKQTQTNYE